MKEYNDYLVLGVPTRFFRDWIVSRYLDKILEQVKNFKLSLNRIEFKIIEENQNNTDLIKIDDAITHTVRQAIEDCSTRVNRANEEWDENENENGGRRPRNRWYDGILDDTEKVRVFFQTLAVLPFFI